MRVLQVHNFYQQPGGEDEVFAAEFDLLACNGHDVRRYSIHNDTLKGVPALSIAGRTIWNSDVYKGVREVIGQFRPEIIHCHNTFPIISPAIYYAASQERVPVVQTLHNYRLICPAATLYRDGHVCEDCLHHSVPYDSVIHNCYRGDRRGSAVVASMLTLHRLAGTWQRKVNTYICLTEFARSKLIEGGLPAQKIVVKPNFLARDPGLGTGEGRFALFVGRLSQEKGLKTLLRAWESLPELPLRIIGDGPLRPFVEAEAERLSNVTALGFCTRSEVSRHMQSATCLVIPSEWYEGLPMTALEAMACGTPLVASDLGSLRELVEEGETGTRFTPGDSDHLSQKIRWLMSQPDTSAALRAKVRLNYEARYTAADNYGQLHRIYENAIATN